MNIDQGNDYLKMFDRKKNETKIVTSELLDKSDKSIVEGFSSCNNKTEVQTDTSGTIPDSVVQKGSSGGDESGQKYEFGTGNINLDDLNEDERRRYHALMDEFTKLIQQYKELHSDLVDSTDTYLTNENIDRNTYGSHSKMFNEEVKYEGIYWDNGNRRVPKWNRVNRSYYAFDVSLCAQTAWDRGDTVFALQHNQGNDPKRTVCFTGTDINRAKSYGKAIEAPAQWAFSWTWGWRRIWRARDWHNAKLGLIDEGSLVMYSGDALGSAADLNGNRYWHSRYHVFGHKGKQTVYVNWPAPDMYSFYGWWKNQRGGWWRSQRGWYGWGWLHYFDRLWLGRSWWAGINGFSLSRPAWWSLAYWVNVSGTRTGVKSAKWYYTPWKDTANATMDNGSGRSVPVLDTRSLSNHNVKCPDGKFLTHMLYQNKYKSVVTGYSKRERQDHPGHDYMFKWWQPETCKSWCNKKHGCIGFNLHRGHKKGCWLKYGYNGPRGTGTWDFYYKNRKRTWYGRYAYRCVSARSGTLKRDNAKYTPWQINSGKGNNRRAQNIYADRLHPRCGTDKVMTSVEYQITQGNSEHSRYKYVCASNTNPNSCFIHVGDDGYLRCYEGSDPSKTAGRITNKVLWTVGRGQRGNYKMQHWLDKRKNGRAYLKAGEFLNKGEWLCSDSGKVIFIYQQNVNWVLRYSRIRGKKLNDGNWYGLGWSNAVYTIPKNDVNYLGKGVYVDKNKNAYRIPNNMLKGGKEFTKISNMNTLGNDIYQINVGKDDSSKYGQFDAQAYLDRYADLRRAFGSDASNPTTKQKAENHWNKYVKKEGRLGGKTSDGAFYECKKACIERDDCQGFVVTNEDKCWLKNQDAYPNRRGNSAPRIIDNNSDYYVRSKHVSNDNSCTSEAANLTTSEIGESLKDVKRWKGQMNSRTPCGLKRATSGERKDLAQKGKEIEFKIKRILFEMNKLTGKGMKYLMEKPEIAKNRQQMISDYDKIFKKIKKDLKTEELLTQSESNAEKELTIKNYKYVLWSVVAIATIIAFIQLRK